MPNKTVVIGMTGQIRSRDVGGFSRDACRGYYDVALHSHQGGFATGKNTSSPQTFTRKCPLSPLHPTPPPPYCLPARPPAEVSCSCSFAPLLLSGEERRRFPFPLQRKVTEIKVLRPVPISICQNYTPNGFKCAPSAIWQPANNRKAQRKHLAVQMQPIHPTSSSSVACCKSNHHKTTLTFQNL